MCTQRAYVWQAKIILMSPAEAAHLMVYTREVFLSDVAKETLGDALHDMIKTEMEVIMALLPDDITNHADEDEVAAYAKEWADLAAHNFIVPMKHPAPAYGKATIMSRVGLAGDAVFKVAFPPKSAKAAAAPAEPAAKTTPRKKAKNK